MSMKHDDTQKNEAQSIDDDLSVGSQSVRHDLPSQYEQQLQKYEGEVRNHIKIEQQLKLHIECT
jgi:hypothetical protein